MPRIVVRTVLLFAVILLFTLQPAAAIEKQAARPLRMAPWEPYMYELPQNTGIEPLFISAAVDTYYLACYDFDPIVWQGWSQKDLTAQEDIFFHVDDFDGLGGGDKGFLAPIEGTRSMWCGARPGGDFYTCGWAAAPGYGNNWDQILDGGHVALYGPLTVSFHGRFDSEPECDKTMFEYHDGGSWKECMSFDGELDTIVVHTLHLAQIATKLRFRFYSDPMWSDEDGVYPSDGACIIDSITIAIDENVIDFEDFESAEVGSTSSGRWMASEGVPFGTYSGLMAGLDFCSEDPCGSNHSTQVIFFEGSTDPYPPCPGLFVTPYWQDQQDGFVLYQNEMVHSPVIDLKKYSTGYNEIQDEDIPGDLGSLGGLILRFAVYQDLDFNSCVSYSCMVRALKDGCPGPWRRMPEERFYGTEREYIFRDIDIGLVLGDGQVDSIQVGLLVENPAWYHCYLDHTPSPWFDNVKVLRYLTLGPQWSYSQAHLFQDKFSSTGDMEGYIRADMAMDINPSNFSGIVPGDSIVISSYSPVAGGLDTLVTGEARVYMHCRASFIGGGTSKPDLAGLQLEGDYGSYVSDDGEWTVLLCEQVTLNGYPVADKYCIDLNDELFTRGYLLEYYFKAYDLDGLSTTLPAGAENAGEPDPDGTDLLFEFTCLPLQLDNDPGVLYVDDYHGRGTFQGIVELYMDLALKQFGPVERYDVNAPSMGVSNGIGAYVSAEGATSIFCQAYDVVVIDSGDLDHMTISYGDPATSDKSNDARLLNDWMDYSNHNVGLWVLGDNVASDLSGSGSTDAIELMSGHCGVSLKGSSYFELSGGIDGGGVPSPLVTGIPGSFLEGLTYYAYGGCPMLKDFDVMTEGVGVYRVPCLKYQDYMEEWVYAGICTEEQVKPQLAIRTVWLGHSMMSVRDKTDIPIHPVRAALGQRVCDFFGRASYPYTDSDIPAVTSLSENFPNPFNPVTRLEYALARKERVSIRIYDVSGRLVRVLVDEVKDAGRYEAVWDGKSSAGHQAASGIYFCRMQAGDFEQSRKMVMLR